MDNFVIYTWTNFHMRDFLLNWMLWLRKARGNPVSKQGAQPRVAAHRAPPLCRLARSTASPTL